MIIMGVQKIANKRVLANVVAKDCGVQFSVAFEAILAEELLGCWRQGPRAVLNVL
jgi:hypothetical protein